MLNRCHHDELDLRCLSADVSSYDHRLDRSPPVISRRRLSLLTTIEQMDFSLQVRTAYYRYAPVQTTNLISLWPLKGVLDSVCLRCVPMVLRHLSPAIACSLCCYHRSPSATVYHIQFVCSKPTCKDCSTLEIHRSHTQKHTAHLVLWIAHESATTAGALFAPM